jgi:hypothetical protein
MVLIQHYGHDAAHQAAANLEALLRRGDAEGAVGWRRVLRVILEVQGIGTQH